MAKHRLLVADDSLTIQKIIRLALSNEDYEIQAVSNGDDALEKMSLFQPSVVLVDVSLPGKSAFDLKREAVTHADLRNIRFVLLSSAFEKVDEDQLEEVGFDGRLVKPFDPQHLRQVLQDVLKDLEPSPASPPAPPSQESHFTPPPISPPAFSPPPAQPELSLDAEESSPELELNLDTETDPLWEEATHSERDPTSTITPPPFSGAAPRDPMISQLSSNSSEEDDIRQLTESTIKMSRLEETDWNVSEPTENNDSSVFTPLSEDAFDDLKLSEPSLTPDPTLESLDLPEDQFSYTPEDSSMEATEPGFTIEQADFSAAPTVDPAQIEEMIKTEVEIRLRELAKELLPDIAERLLKEEIHRMLESQNFDEPERPHR